MRAELFHDALAVGLDGAVRNAELEADLLVGETVGDTFQYLSFPTGQPVRFSPEPVDRSGRRGIGAQARAAGPAGRAGPAELGAQPLGHLEDRCDDEPFAIGKPG